MERNHDDDKTLKPHSHVDQDGNDEDGNQVLAEPLDPENLRNKHVATHHEEPGPLVRAKRAVHEVESLKGVAAIPGDEELHGVGIANDGSRRQRDFAHDIDVPHRDDIFQLEHRAQRNQQRQYHPEPGENGTGDEVGRENGGMPSWQLGNGEVQRDD